MPTADEFRDAAQTLRAARTQTSTLLYPITNTYGPDVITGGVLTAALERALDMADDDVNHVMSECARLADECEWRAIQCDQFAAAMKQWRHLSAVYDASVARYHLAVERHNAHPDINPAPTYPTNPPSIPRKRYDWIVI
jgi:hypothetical protein